jgi:chromosome segregation ATPase
MEDINSESFKIELDNIRNDYKKAKDILQKIEVFSVRFEEAKKLLNDTNDGIDVNYENIKKKRQEIDILYTQSQSTVSQITENLNKVGTQIESMQSSYNDFSEIK